MKKILSLVLSLSVGFLSFIAVAATPARAQEIASVGKSISELKEQYERLLAVERDPSTPSEVRELNQRFLEERRTQLRAAIEKRLRALRNYHTSVGSTLSNEETLVVQNSIGGLEKDLSALTGEAQRAAAATPSRVPAKSSSASRARVVKAHDTLAEVIVEASPSAAETAVAPLPAAATPVRQDPPKITVESAKDKVAEPKTKVTVKLQDASNKLGKNIKVAVTSGENKKVATATINRTGDDGRLIAEPSAEVEVDLFKGENSVVASGTTPDGTAISSAAVKVTYEPPAPPEAAQAAAPAKPKTPGIDFVDAGSTRIRVFNLVPGATVLLKINGAEKVNQPAINAEDIYRVDPVSAGDKIELTQTLNSQTSEGARFEVTQGPLDTSKGGPFGILMGGAVISQQADAFQQADPFFGFIAGYSSKTRGYAKTVKRGAAIYTVMEDGTWTDAFGDVVEGFAEENRPKYKYVNGVKIRSTSKPTPSGGFGVWRWNLRFQGVFQSSPRKAVATQVATASPTPTPTPTPSPTPVPGGVCANNEPCFIASRKTFDVEAHAWIDLWANNAFTIGPYGAFGASTVLDDNELQGEAIASPSPEGGGNTNQAVTNATSSNDLKKFFEIGALSNIHLFDRKLFVQSIVGYGFYEALGGLYQDKEGCWGCDSRRRFVGKLRIFPSGLNRGFGRQIEAAPMFGVDLNAGRGPDHIKFFTGFAVAIKGFNLSGPSAK